MGMGFLFEVLKLDCADGYATLMNTLSCMLQMGQFYGM